MARDNENECEKDCTWFAGAVVLGTSLLVGVGAGATAQLKFGSSPEVATMVGTGFFALALMLQLALLAWVYYSCGKNQNQVQGQAGQIPPSPAYQALG